LPLLGADGFLTAHQPARRAAARSGLEVGQIDHLLGRYGGLVDEAARAGRGRPELADRCRHEDYLAAEVVYAVTHEGARHLDDVLARRTRISIETFDRGTVAVAAAADLMAGELGWDDARRETRSTTTSAGSRPSGSRQQKLTDQEADEARVSAPDIV
jgi:glycerol-3-phosphate dehydrogenase